MKGLIQGLGLNVILLDWTFKPIPFVNTGPGLKPQDTSDLCKFFNAFLVKITSVLRYFCS